MKTIKHLWKKLVEWFNGDGAPDIEMTPQQLAELSEPGSLEGWE